MMRIITGKARGVRLATPEGEHTRPTAERTKEALFSMLQFELMGTQVLDLFAGSGQLGLEALSRGAKYAVLCDNNKTAAGIVHQNAIKTKLALQCEVHCMDYAALLSRLRRKKSFDLVFLDPPYALGLVPKALKLLVDYQLLSQNAKVICETASEDDVFAGNEELKNTFDVIKVSRYGVAYVTVLQLRAGNKEDEQ